jgi:hypothetical protein
MAEIVRHGFLGDLREQVTERAAGGRRCPDGDAR